MLLLLCLKLLNYYKPLLFMFASAQCKNVNIALCALNRIEIFRLINICIEFKPEIIVCFFGLCNSPIRWIWVKNECKSNWIYLIRRIRCVCVDLDIAQMFLFSSRSNPNEMGCGCAILNKMKIVFAFYTFCQCIEFGIRKAIISISHVTLISSCV